MQQPAGFATLEEPLLLSVLEMFLALRYLGFSTALRGTSTKRYRKRYPTELATYPVELTIRRRLTFCTTEENTTPDKFELFCPRKRG